MSTRLLSRTAGALVTALIGSLQCLPSFAQSPPGAEYDPDLSPATDYAYEFVLTPGQAEIEADLDYVRRMREHHAGALTMSKEYLADPQARNPVLKRLARAIIPNQQFEISELNEVEQQVKGRITTLLSLGSKRLLLRPAAVEDLAQRWRFSRASIPTPLDVMIIGGPVSERDVKFAKGMSIHHAAALDMARSYNANPNGENTWLRRLNHDIIVDQQQEIWTMNAVIARYPGDASKIEVDPSMIHGMGGMNHGGGHGSATRHGGHAGHQPQDSSPMSHGHNH